LLTSIDCRFDQKVQHHEAGFVGLVGGVSRGTLGVIVFLYNTKMGA
jgi:hypothetical protein